VRKWADALPKTRSGKMMRRLLGKIATGDVSEMGDILTLLDANEMHRLIEGRRRNKHSPP